MQYKSNRIKDLKSYFSIKLSKKFGREKANLYVNMLIAEIISEAIYKIPLIIDRPISESKINLLEKYCNELLADKPIQYVIGKTEFFGLELKVNKNVLIPRDETEILVDLLIKNFKKEEGLKILDIGTGSGCIAISLAKNLNKAILNAVDISEEALKTSSENAEKNQAEIEFKKIDILNESEWDNITSKYDLIVSNPPYVRESEKKLMDRNVLSYEPHSALFVKDKNPLIFYEHIAKFAQNNLSERGVLAFEINEFLGDKTKKLLKENGFSEIDLIRDYNNKDRFVLCRLG